MTTDLHRSPSTGLDLKTFHDLLKLRVDVFVVEQECAYPELDGRDLEPGTEHLWFADENGPTAYVRVLTDPDGAARIGRVCTRADARGRSLAGKLISAVLEGLEPGRPSVLDAQAHLQNWYARFGFAVSGPEYIEDGIPHVPMHRPAPQTAGATATAAR